jgi:hypothetical protein
MSEGMKLVGCRAMGDALIEVLQAWFIYLYSFPGSAW